MKIKKNVAILFVLFLLACGSATLFSAMSAPVIAKAATIKINKKRLSLDKGQTYKLKIIGTNRKVTWKSSKPAVVKVNSKGKITAKKAGRANIIAKVKGKKYTCTVTVKDKKSKSKMKFIASTTNLSINQSGTVTITYTGDGSLYYDIKDTNVCSCSWTKKWKKNTIKLRILGKSSGTTTITITNSTNSKKIRIKVNVDLYAQSVNISSPKQTIYMFDTITLQASVFPTYANQGIVWSSSNENVASVSDGTVYAISKGQTIITATSADGHCSAQCILTVLSPINFAISDLPMEVIDGSSIYYIDNIYYEIQSFPNCYRCKICIEGEKRYDGNGNNNNESFFVDYKVSKDGFVYESGSFLSPPLKVGERFSDCTYVYLDNAGDYQLELFK